MKKKNPLIQIIPVLPSQNIERDVLWYQKQTGFQPIFQNEMYAGLKRDDLQIHLQWHADTPDDPLLGGSVIRVFVNDIQIVFNEFLKTWNGY